MEVVPSPARDGAGLGRTKTTSALVGARVEKQSGESKLTFDPAAGRLVAFSRRHRYQVKYTYRAEACAGTERTTPLATTIGAEKVSDAGVR